MIKLKLDPKTVQNISNNIKRNLQNISVEFANQGGEPPRAEIKKLIEAGISPVEGVGRFKGYSESYTEQIKSRKARDEDGKIQSGKRIRPVNLTLSGKLLKSLKVKALGNKIQISFNRKTKSGDDLAKIINDGGRRILPTERGERFHRSITKKFIEIASKIIRKYLDK
jgi:hypothetical protein